MNIFCCYRDLGVVNYCTIITTDITVPQAGTYFLKHETESSLSYVEIEIAADNAPIKINTSYFPINQELFLELLDGDLNPVTLPDCKNNIRLFIKPKFDNVGCP